jgi:hypothetical protein
MLFLNMVSLTVTLAPRREALPRWRLEHKGGALKEMPRGCAEDRGKNSEISLRVRRLFGKRKKDCIFETSS